ncbi:MAG: hypothetical protein N3D14_03475 [Aquificaceae bacterium]|nr:hypothetical protein [Aquificaceae bacterium]
MMSIIERLSPEDVSDWEAVNNAFALSLSLAEPLPVGSPKECQSLFQPETITLANGEVAVLPNAIWSAPMEQNAATAVPFISQDDIEDYSPSDILERCFSLLSDPDYLRRQYLYGANYHEVNWGNGVPSLLTFLKVWQQAQGGAGVVCFEATVPEQSFLARKRGLIISEGNLLYYKKIKEVFDYYKVDPNQKLILQMMHGGWLSKELMGVNCVPNKWAEPPPLREISEVLFSVIKGVELVASVGWDGVDIKLCHGYGLGDRWWVEVCVVLKDIEPFIGHSPCNSPHWYETFIDQKKHLSVLDCP